MSLQIGKSYRMKSYIHNFLEDITVVSLYTDTNTNTQIVVIKRSGGQIIHMTEEDVLGADYYPLDNDDDEKRESQTTTK